MKKIMILFLAIFANAFFGGVIASTINIHPAIGAVGINIISAVSPLFGLSGVVRSGLYTEVWTGEMIKQFRNSMESIGWISRIRSYDNYVASNNTMHFVDIGGDPKVLINNTTYPIGVASLTDADKAIGLDKYQTEATKVTDDELRGLSYDKKATVIERHLATMTQLKYARALHALSPSANSTDTPVLTTTGDAVAGRKQLKREDIISLKQSFDAQKIPNTGRVLVLSTDHANDLLRLDQKFAEQYHNYTTGKISNLYGFEVFEYADCPYFTAATKAKLPFGAEPQAGDYQASVAFYAPRMMKATGETKAYIDEPDTQMQEWRVNYRHYFICLPLKEQAIGAIVSGI